MNTQLSLLDAAPRKRAVLLEDQPAAPKGEVVEQRPTRRGRLKLVQREPLQNPEEAAVGYTEWFLRKVPPCIGWWDTRVKGTDEHQRLWFVPSDDPITGGGIWYEQARRSAVGLKFVGSHEEVGGQTEWRGLCKPWPSGYDYDVPGADAFLALGRKRFREVLL